MQTITRETRKESYISIQPKQETRRQIILSVLEEKPMTVNEIAETLLKKGIICYYDRNFVAPRLTELKQAGAVAVLEKKTCPRTGRMVAVWGAVKE